MGAGAAAWWLLGLLGRRIAFRARMATGDPGRKKLGNTARPPSPTWRHRRSLGRGHEQPSRQLRSVLRSRLAAATRTTRLRYA